MVTVARWSGVGANSCSAREFDPVFGPVVMVGDGGRYVEAFNDIALLLAPVSTEQVREALQTLRIARVPRRPARRSAARRRPVVRGRGPSRRRGRRGSPEHPLDRSQSGDGRCRGRGPGRRRRAGSSEHRALGLPGGAGPLPCAEASDTRCRSRISRPAGRSGDGRDCPPHPSSPSPARRPDRAASGRGDAAVVAAAGHLRRPRWSA